MTGIDAFAMGGRFKPIWKLESIASLLKNLLSDAGFSNFLIAIGFPNLTSSTRLPRDKTDFYKQMEKRNGHLAELRFRTSFLGSHRD